MRVCLTVSQNCHSNTESPRNNKTVWVRQDQLVKQDEGNLSYQNLNCLVVLYVSTPLWLYLPVNRGCRFSRNARTPSRPSSDSKHRRCASTSYCSICSSESCSAA